MEVALHKVVVLNMNVEFHIRLGVLVLGLYALKFNMHMFLWICGHVGGVLVLNTWIGTHLNWCICCIYIYIIS